MTALKMKITPLDPWICQKIAVNPAQLSRQAVEAWQVHKLNETLALARTRSPFYRNLFFARPESIACLEDLRQFPFTTPDDIRQNPGQFLCVPPGDIQRVVTLHSSGTTGEPKRIYFTAEDQALTIDFFGVGMSTLTEPGERVLILLPGETPGSVGDLLRLGLAHQDRIPLPYGPVRHPQAALDTMQNQRADCLVGSPTQVLSLARRWKPGNRAPRTILLSTDYVPAAIVRELEAVWGCTVFNHYGSTEMGLGGGVECHARRGYHLRAADLYFEIVDPVTGKILPDGEYGEVVFTTLTRRGMPLIRYRMGDRSRFVPGPCPCGTRLQTLEKVSGRFGGFCPVGDDWLHLPDLDEVLFPIPGLLNFTATLTDDGATTSLAIETQMLAGGDATALVEKALRAVPAAQKINLAIRCVHNPNETGSLLKRVIVDQRRS